MRPLVVLSALAALTGCPRAERPTSVPRDAAPTVSLPEPTPVPVPTEADDGALVLVEAELASRLQRGQVGEDEFCEADVPRLVLTGGTLELLCGQRSERLTVESERTSGGRRRLKIAGGRQIVLEEQGQQRFRVSGNPCDRQPTVYVVFPEARSFRARWLRSATCPTEDMKLAR
ncbi:MAG: hypothetical protein JXR83_04680 [Deltaproteobacteria bacterium]|nr:hypothetical protein [Deltaproteobacteria bacterium]